MSIVQNLAKYGRLEKLEQQHQVKALSKQTRLNFIQRKARNILTISSAMCLPDSGLCAHEFSYVMHNSNLLCQTTPCLPNPQVFLAFPPLNPSSYQLIKVNPPISEYYCCLTSTYTCTAVQILPVLHPVVNTQTVRITNGITSPLQGTVRMPFCPHFLHVLTRFPWLPPHHCCVINHKSSMPTLPSFSSCCHPPAKHHTLCPLLSEHKPPGQGDSFLTLSMATVP